ncbi:hypothetical protein CXQ85_004352 [Candidozyma haemuli]|uniref:Uncharacterized protein n=1 Tax=Candidozyma haemuli TaxID=45357 RepID=A0A2V1ASX6_9ASCO|nr:hypothetical protein CXQ85_004352 [[Candida] haemuloni]PVH20844.1 hypothetical protein CXQ85_004352 [[Candida] haemuloni]
MSFRALASAPATALTNARAVAQRTHTRFIQSIYRRFQEVSSSLGSWFRPESFLSLDGLIVPRLSHPAGLQFMRQAEMMFLMPGFNIDETSFTSTTDLDEQRAPSVPVQETSKNVKEPAQSLELLTWEEPEVPKTDVASEWQTVKPRRQKRKVEGSPLPSPTIIPSTLQKLTKKQNIKQQKMKQQVDKLEEPEDPIVDTSNRKMVNIYDCLSKLTMEEEMKVEEEEKKMKEEEEKMKMKEEEEKKMKEEEEKKRKVEEEKMKMKEEEKKMKEDEEKKKMKEEEVKVEEKVKQKKKKKKNVEKFVELEEPIFDTRKQKKLTKQEKMKQQKMKQMMEKLKESEEEEEDSIFDTSNRKKVNIFECLSV